MRYNRLKHRRDCISNLPLFIISLGLFSISIIPSSGFIIYLSAEPAFELKKREQPKNNNDEADEDEDEVDDEDEDEDKFKHTLKGFVELENYFSTFLEQDFKDVFKKNEIRNNLNYKFGNDRIFFQVDMNLYFTFHIFSEKVNPEYIYSNDNFEFSRNLRMSGKGYEINFQKLYFNYVYDWLRLRLGNQVYSWGTADIFNPTSYFNPFDLRELLFKDEDELAQSIPSLSTMITFGDHSIELITVPIHVPMVMAESGNFWAIKYEEGPFPVQVEKPEGMDITLKNTALGIQYSTNMFETDINLSYYHGPDKEPVMRPIGTILIPNEPINLYIAPQYHLLNMFGLSLSRTIYKFALQAEAVYSWDKRGVISQYNSRYLFLPFVVKKSHFVSYSTGFNFFIPISDLISSREGDLVFVTEWNQSVFFDKEIMKPMITDVLVMRLQDSFIDNKLNVSVTVILDVPNLNYVIMPQAEYKFDMGISINASYIYIQGGIDNSIGMYEKMETGSFLGYYNNNDIINVRVRYEY